MRAIPERLRGRYNRIGWTANGIEPWGLSPDPIGSEGNLFFRGWFNLLLGIYKYVSGDDKYERPFSVTGYGDERFEWDQHRIAALLESQYRERPEGPHCENTKIWFPCNSAAGLGLYLYDRVYGRDTHRPVQGWLEYARDNFIGMSGDGRLEWVTRYYDPIVNHKANGGPGAAVGRRLPAAAAGPRDGDAALRVGRQRPRLERPERRDPRLDHRHGDGARARRPYVAGAGCARRPSASTTRASSASGTRSSAGGSA